MSSLLTTTEAVIVEFPKNDLAEGAPPMGAAGMGGMGGMGGF